MTVYHQHMTQRVPSDPYWRVNCTAYCAAMLINDATLGGLYRVTGANVRAYSNEPKPDPASPGLNISQIRNVAQRNFRVTLADRTGNGWSTLMTELHNNRRILLQLDYGSLQEQDKCQSGGNFDHAVVLVRDTGLNTILVSDPLCSSAKNMSETALRKAATDFGNKHGGKLWWAMTRPIPILR